MPLQPLLRSSSLIQINLTSKMQPPPIISPKKDTIKNKQVVPVAKKMTQLMSTSQSIDAALEPFFLAVNPTAYELDPKSRNLLVTSGSYRCQERLYLSSAEFWHKIVIVGGSKYYRDYVLKLIIAAAHPHDLIPVKYLKHENDTCFFLRECASAIEKLCRSDLQIENPHGESIRLRVIVCAKSLGDIPINTQAIINKIIMKRYNSDKKSLNLSDFHNDADLKDAIFCPLSQPRILFYVLNLINNRTVPFEFLSLANNELVTLKSMEGLTCFKNLRSLDLSRNKIAEIGELIVLNAIPLKDLTLDNNPLCQNFEEELSYIQKVREVVPKITILDGVKLRPEGTPRARRNYLAYPQAGPVVDQFIDHYFRLYDGPNRWKLNGIYHHDARFSITCSYIPGQSTSSTANLQPYMAESRNLLKLSDYSKTHNLLHMGQEAILRILTKLPKTEHDLYTFSVDVPIFIGVCVMIHVTGVFRDSPNKAIRAFSRIFHLVCVLPGEWQITNEMVHISNARTEDVARAFKFPQLQRPLRVNNTSTADKLKLTKMLARVTRMKLQWASKCLEDTNWELPDALRVFIEMYKRGKIPRFALRRQM